MSEGLSPCLNRSERQQGIREAFDPLFYQHHGLYRQGETYTFSLAALAYAMAPTGGEEIVIDDPDGIRAFRARNAWAESHGYWTREDEAAALAVWKPSSPEDLEPIRIDLSRGSMLLPGEVTRVIPSVRVLFGVPIWRVDVVVASADEEVLTLPFYVPERCLRDDWRPQPGDCVKGSAWVQGYLVPDDRLH